MKKKYGIIAVLSILNVPLSVVLSMIIHSKLTNIEYSNIVINKQIALLFILIYLLIEVIIFILFSYKNKNIFESQVTNITNKLKTPEVVGQGQYGTSRWLTNKEFEKAFKVNILENNELRDFDSGGIVVGFKKNKKREKIYYIDDNIHSLVLGATRSRKNKKYSFRNNRKFGFSRGKYDNK